MGLDKDAVSGKALAAGTGQESPPRHHRWLAPFRSGETAEPHRFAPEELVVYERGMTRKLDCEAFAVII